MSSGVRLSVCHVGVLYCIHKAEDIGNLLSPPGSPVILVFDLSADTQFQGEPLQLGHKIHGRC